MEVLIVVPELVSIGPTRVALDLAEALPRVGVATVLFAIRPAGLEQVPHGGIESPVTVGWPEGMRLRYALPVIAARLFPRAARADVVLSANEVGNGLVAAYAGGRAARKPVVVSVQNNLPKSLDVASQWDRRAAEHIYPRVDVA